MDDIKPPTDNLYKFIAIFGLALFVLATYFAERFKTELTASFNDIEHRQVESLTKWREFYLMGMPIEIVGEYRNWTGKDEITDKVPDDNEKKQTLNRFDELHEKVLRLCNFPIPEDPNAKAHWSHTLGLKEGEYEKMAADRFGKNPINEMIGKARTLLTEVEFLPMLQKEQWHLKTTYNRVRTFQELGILLSLAMIGFGFWWWWRRVQMHQDIILLAESTEKSKSLAPADPKPNAPKKGK